MELDVIHKKIYLVRGKNVMLDFDLALLYETETKKIKQAVRRNSKRFPEDFMFELTRKEFTHIKERIRSQNVTHVSLSDTYMPFAFTEQGVAMLASILKSEKAIKVNIEIVRSGKAVQVSINIIEVFINYRVSRYANYSLNFLLLKYICIIIAYRDMQ